MKEPKSIIDLTLPYPPTVNSYWRHVGHKVLISAKGRAYRQAVSHACFLEATPRLEGRLAVDILVYPPDARRRDLDNICKSALDSLAMAGLYDDDEQIDYLTVVRREQTPGGKIVVALTEVGPAK